MRSIVSSAIVPCTSAIGAGSMSSIASPTARRAPAAGAARRSSGRANRRTPYFQSSVRPDDRRRDAVGFGAARRLDLSPRRATRGTCRTAGRRACSICDATVRAGAYDAIASVARNNSTSAPSASTTSAITCPGCACSSASASSSAACALPVLPTVDERSSTSASFATPSRAAIARGPRGRACR